MLPAPVCSPPGSEQTRSSSSAQDGSVVTAGSYGQKSESKTPCSTAAAPANGQKRSSPCGSSACLPDLSGIRFPNGIGFEENRPAHILLVEGEEEVLYCYTSSLYHDLFTVAVGFGEDRPAHILLVEGEEGVLYYYSRSLHQYTETSL